MNESLAETIEWQARCGDLQTSNEQLREERDAARKAWKDAKEISDIYWQRVLDLEKALNVANAKIVSLQQWSE